MPSLKDKKVDAIYAMFKGEPGTRKSTCALGFPGPIYYFDCDMKMDALVTPAKKWGLDMSSVDYDTYNDWVGIQRKLEQLQGTCKYKTIVIDSVTSVGDSINRQTRRLKSGTTSTSTGAEKGGRVAGIAVNTIEDYKAEASAFDTIISATKDIQNFHKCNIILIAHVVGERIKKDAGDLTNAARIIITGGKTISGKIPAYCSEVYHFDVDATMDTSKPPEYILYTVHTGADFARTSLPLESKISFGDKNLYTTYIRPAIDKLNG